MSKLRFWLCLWEEKRTSRFFFFCPLFDLDFFSSSSPAGQTSHPERLWSTVSFLFSSPVESTAVFFAGDSPDCTAGFITASGGGLLETRDGHAYARERERERQRRETGETEKTDREGVFLSSSYDRRYERQRKSFYLHIRIHMVLICK